MRTTLAYSTLALVASLLITGCAHPGTPHHRPADWHATLNERLPEYGHRNIIGIVDAAYPAQTRPGVEMITADAGQLEVVRAVLSGINARDHVRPVVFTDAELTHVAEADAPGITAYRDALAAVLNGTPATRLPHDKIIATVDDTAQTFKVLLIKTPLALPYTSVFVRLECGYWSDDAEKRLRESMNAAAPKGN
jgi:hypothetical protein